MKIQIEVENIRCGGCANTIAKKLLLHKQIQKVAVDIENQKIDVEALSDIRVEIIQILLKLGYPEKGTLKGIGALKGKAKSVISCAIGKIDLVVDK